MSNTLTIRLGVQDDHAAIVAIIREAFTPYIARMGKEPGPMLEDYAALIDSQCVHVGDDRHGIAGVVSVLPLERKALLDTMAVANRARGLGFGRILVAHAESLARAAGLPEIILYTHETMTENRAIYSHLGYRETHSVSEKGFDRIYFSKMLAR